MASTQTLSAAEAARRIGQPLLEPGRIDRSNMIGGEVDFLREENKQLRELVIQLSKIVLKNVMDGH
jgi:hypothetical protein